MSCDRPTAAPYWGGGGGCTFAETRFIPRRYEPNYAYPLLVLFHGRGGDENQLVGSLPRVSWRNYVGLGLRGPELVHRGGRAVGYGWGPGFARPGRRDPRTESTRGEPSSEIFRRALRDDAPETLERIDEAVFEAVYGVRRALHVHSERIFLVGVGEGAAVAYRLGLCYPEKFAGVVALNGWLPPGVFHAPVRIRECRSQRVLVVHGEWNGRAPVARARRDVMTLRAAGLHVAFQSYPCANRLTSPMLSDVDTWLIHQCTADL
jgi:phospholipase/carboxylesterase